MYFFLLQAGVSIDVDQMKFENLALVVGAALIAIILVFMYGITLKWGDKEIVIGALKRLLAKKDEDTRLKEELKRLPMMWITILQINFTILWMVWIFVLKKLW
jgi:hypothetical protein